MMTLKLIIFMLNLLIVRILALPMDRTTGNPSTSGRYDKKADDRAVQRQAFDYVEHAYKQVQKMNGHNLQLCASELTEASKMCKDQSGQHSPKSFHKKSYLQASDTLLDYAKEKIRTEDKDHIHICEKCKKTWARDNKRKNESQSTSTSKSHDHHQPPEVGSSSPRHTSPKASSP